MPAEARSPTGTVGTVTTGEAMTVRRWRLAMADALYGDNGFFRRAAPSDHFRTSVHTGAVFADAIARVVGQVDAALGHPEPLDIVDLGAGRAELLTALDRQLDPKVRGRVRFTAVELAPRPDHLDTDMTWQDRLPQRLTGVLVAAEWLDNIPVDVVTRDRDGWRYVLVDQDGTERSGDMPDQLDARWLDAWWPDGRRAEIGRTRDEAWADAVSRLDRGLALAIDYGHTRDNRPVLGTLSGYRDGRQVPPVPNGLSDLTAHVAIDAVAAATGHRSALLRQADVLRALGVTGRRPPLSLATEDPGGYMRALAAATVAAELTDETGLGGHYWLWQPVRISVPAPTMNG